MQQVHLQKALLDLVAAIEDWYEYGHEHASASIPYSVEEGRRLKADAFALVGERLRLAHERFISFTEEQKTHE